MLDIPLFVIASGLAAFGVRWAAWTTTGWTVLVAVALCLLVLGRIPAERIAAGPIRFRLARRRTAPATHLAATLGQITVFWGFFLAVVPVLIVAIRWRSPASCRAPRPAHTPRYPPTG